MVMVLLLSGIMLLHGSARLLEQSMAGIADETAYLRDFYQAQSALQWGLLRQWPSANGWQCQSPATQDWQSCLLWQTPETALLLGMSASGEKSLWRQVVASKNGRQTVVAVPAGWTDLCPLPDETLCAVSQPRL
ncbi:hypothetical protein A7K99_04500 [Tatumella citrea]|uniref:DUF2509 domain-containing protein n=2 Tax=Tatumella citrea TaxID=53336 RepID=A0A1Y0LDT5_TATCI|nr:hypothetical protein A7K98_04500 [Tatumella citrea]ARV00075.1 hypothetical protein A7K99_04500 [Tatumella citrea]